MTDKPTSTSPDGNTGKLKPSQLEHGVSQNADAKLRRDHPDQHKRVRELVARKNAGGDGHGRP